MRGHGHVELCWGEVGELVQGERRLVTVDAFNFLAPVPGPKCPKDEVGPVSLWKESEPVDAAVFADPVPDLHMIGVCILGESSGFGLLGGEEALLLLGELEEPS